MDASVGSCRWRALTFCAAFSSLHAVQVNLLGRLDCLLTLSLTLTLTLTPGRAVQMNLLDRAVKMAAEQDEPEEMNFVRKHAREQAEQQVYKLHK